MSQSSVPSEPALARRRRVGAVLATSAASLLALAAVALAAGRAPRTGLYSGSSSEREPVTLTVKKVHRRLAVVSVSTTIGYDGKCGQGGGPGFMPVVRDARIKHGRFSATVTFKGEVSSIPSKKGTVTGRFSAGKVKGTIGLPGLKLKNGCQPYVETYHATWKHR